MAFPVEMVVDDQLVVAVDAAEDAGKTLVGQVLDVQPNPGAPGAEAGPGVGPKLGG